MDLNLHLKKFSFNLLKPLQTSQGIIRKRNGWLIKVINEIGKCGWGEIAPFNELDLNRCENYLMRLGQKPTRNQLEEGINSWPAELAFGIGAALAEIDCLIEAGNPKGWLKSKSSAVLLPAGDSDKVLKNIENILKTANINKDILTFKLKVGVIADYKEQNLLKRIFEILPSNVRFRLDANGSWSRSRAWSWCDLLIDEPRIEWIEQPLPPNDIEGLWEISHQLPIALDESLFFDPSLRQSWPGWQVRRPTLEGDPRNLLRELQDGLPYRAISTSFETGIGLRWVNHLAALQQNGPTPTAPGLARGWCSSSSIFNLNPEIVWKSA